MLRDLAPREFHISRRARERYQFEDSLFSLTGNVLFANFRAARLFAQRMNEKRDLLRFPEQAVRAGHVNAMGLIDEILHYVIRLYREQKNPRVIRQALDWLDDHIGRTAVDTALAQFADEFPVLAVYRGQTPLAEFLKGETAGVPNRQIVLEEMLMLWLANMNPAFSPFLELFDDTALERRTAYLPIMTSLHDFFDTQPRFGPDRQNLIDMLRSPALAAPSSLTEQLNYILSRWRYLLGAYLARLLSSLDLIKEEERAGFLGPGPALVPVYGYAGIEFEPERYSPDLHWMPNLVLIAKNTYVWLDQLSKKYGRSIGRLDEIPDAELDLLAHWGFTGLWLIGIWERSPASRKIKQRMGNPEAVASAYSVFDYVVAENLGGEAACANLRERAWARGIRLASDMVPNHMGIDSHWVIEHPDWFISLDHSPFPSYSYNGPELSWDPRVGIFIEDHYYNRTDAAVTFKRLDRWTGSERYIYHGNDGTSMPWNDTAQLNFLIPAVREAVIQTILHVARQFHVIRFDAAMTLAKKHYQRLWFPEPGTGGAIPSRAEHGMSKAEFDRLMPEEFWREVVDRVASEAPDTLLLAEAFWLMEGYFVRSLGMHRVYNSAFMNMLRDEDNAKYRSVMKNTLEFDPEILKRYVNFMNNPDERTAVDQFGKGDKYFGVCTMMVTLPGLPMFGHGQIQGFEERYGMEYRRAYWGEEADPELVRRHEREIFPLMRKRYLFAGVDSFLLYDFFAPEGYADENVFAYSNCAGEERALIVYHNKYAEARGWIRTSAAYSLKDGPAEERRLVQRNLGEGWNLHAQSDYFAIFRDQVTDLEYIRNSRELFAKGLYVELKAYQRHVFMDVREVQDTEQHLYAQVAERLGGRGVPSIEEALQEITLQPIHVPFKELVNPGMFRWLLDARVTQVEGQVNPAPLDAVEQKMQRLLSAVKEFTGGTGDPAALAQVTRRELEAMLRLPVFSGRFYAPRSKKYADAMDYLEVTEGDTFFWGTLFGWLFVHGLGRMLSEKDAAGQSRAWMDEWLLGRVLEGALRELGLGDAASRHAVALAKLLTAHQGWLQVQNIKLRRVYPYVESWLKDDDVRQFLKVNRFNGVLWFNKESFEQFLWWMYLLAVLETSIAEEGAKEEGGKQMVAAYEVIEEVREAEMRSEFQVIKLLAVTRQMDARPAQPRRPRAGAGTPRNRIKVR